MKITIEQLIEKNACEPGLDWFRDTFGIEVEITKENLDKFRRDYLDWLFENFIDILPIDECWRHPFALYWAAGNGRTEIVGALLDKGANPENSNALTSASYDGHTETVRLLLDKGTNPDNPGALRWAIHFGHTEIVQLLKEFSK